MFFFLWGANRSDQKRPFGGSVFSYIFASLQELVWPQLGWVFTSVKTVCERVKWSTSPQGAPTRGVYELPHATPLYTKDALLVRVTIWKMKQGLHFNQMSKLVSQKQSTLCWRWGTSTEKSRLPWTQSYLLSLQVISTNSSSCSCSHKSGLHSQMKAVSVFLCSTAHFSSHRTASLNLRPSHFLFPQILPMVTQLNSEERLPNN